MIENLIFRNSKRLFYYRSFFQLSLETLTLIAVVSRLTTDKRRLSLSIRLSLHFPTTITSSFHFRAIINGGSSKINQASAATLTDRSDRAKAPLVENRGGVEWLRGRFIYGVAITQTDPKSLVAIVIHKSLGPLYTSYPRRPSKETAISCPERVKNDQARYGLGLKLSTYM